MCPTSKPGEKISLLPAPSGSHFASTSSSRMRASKPRPPSLSQVGGTGSFVNSCVRVFTRQTFIFTPTPNYADICYFVAAFSAPSKTFKPSLICSEVTFNGGIQRMVLS